MTVTSNGVLAVDSGATLNVNGNVSIATPLVLAGTMTVSSPSATIAMADLAMPGGSFTLLNGQNMNVQSVSGNFASNYGGLVMGPGSTFNMSGGSLVCSSGNDSQVAIGSGAFSGSDSAVFTISQRHLPRRPLR